jgi:hypothetical protein
MQDPIDREFVREHGLGIEDYAMRVHMHYL